MNLTRGINLRKISEMMPGASGAEVKGVCTEAGMYALRERRVHVTQEDFELAVAKVCTYGSPRLFERFRPSFFMYWLLCKVLFFADHVERLRKEHVHQKVVEIVTYLKITFLSVL